jgi:hypothetical protein
VAGLLKSVPVKVVIVGMASIILLSGGALSRGYVTRLESVEQKVEKIDKMANDIEWIKKYLESNRR